MIEGSTFDSARDASKHRGAWGAARRYQFRNDVLHMVEDFGFEVSLMPSLDFVQQSAEQGGVQSFLEHCLFALGSRRGHVRPAGSIGGPLLA